MIAPARGLHRDHWTEAHFNAVLLSERALCECTLELWLRPDSGANIAPVIVKINGKERYATQLKIGQLNTIKFPIDVAAGTIFEVDVVCDYVKPPEPADKRPLSYILRSLKFA